MNNALSFDIEDWFQVENLKPAIPREQWDKLELRVEASTRKILALLRESGAHATFFILGWVAERCPQLVRDIDRDGHEVASHGYGHGLVYDMTPEAFREDLLRSKRILEGITGKPVIGYRAPSFSITPRNLWALDILKETGFEYDSSVFPVSMHDRYGFPDCSPRPFVWPNGLVEIPLAVYRIGRLSLPAAGGGYFRLFPYGYFRRIFQRLNRRDEAVTFYMHPWELDPGQPRVKVPWFYRFRHYVNLDKTESRLRMLLRDFRFTSIPVAHALDVIRKNPHPAQDRLRIAFIIDHMYSSTAGTESQLVKLINGLDPQRFEVSLICFNDSPWIREHRSSLACQTHVLDINRVSKGYTYVNVLKMVKLLRAMRPDLVQTYFPVANIVGVIAARLAGVKQIVSSRRDLGVWVRRDYLWATRFANRFVSRFAVNSRSVSELTQRLEKVDGRRIEVIYNGIDLGAFSGLSRDEKFKQELGIPQVNKVVGLVANYRPVKRHDVLVRAAHLILQHRNDVDFLLIGQDEKLNPLQGQTEALARSLGISERLHFIAGGGGVMRYLSIMDVGINCSETEGLSNAVMEYMAAGVACVVSDGGGNPELVGANVHGAVFKVNDHAGLAAEVLRLCDSAQLRSRYAASARRRMETEMSLPVMLEAHAGLYRRLASVRPR
jgi:polysaccharide deacetylase family protein (PEP-CTERM system associated)